MAKRKLRNSLRQDHCPGVLFLPIVFTARLPISIIPMVLLIGNYPLDCQQSMQRFTTMMLQGLTTAGIPAEVAAPTPVLGEFFGVHNFIGKWLAYVDKFVLFPRQLRTRLAGGPAIL